MQHNISNKSHNRINSSINSNTNVSFITKTTNSRSLSRGCFLFIFASFGSR